jgi:hypothetical protein
MRRFIKHIRITLTLILAVAIISAPIARAVAPMAESCQTKSCCGGCCSTSCTSDFDGDEIGHTCQCNMTDGESPAEEPVNAEVKRVELNDRYVAAKSVEPVISDVISGKYCEDCPSPLALSFYPLYINHCAFLI